ncbi:lactonase family protein [Parasphingorhabdus pacifica]
MPVDDEYRIYVGAYTGPDSDAGGISLLVADPGGGLGCAGRATRAMDPSFLALAPDSATLFAVSESMEGRVIAFAVRADGTLRETNSQPSMGAAPCHLSVHPSGNFLFTAHYVTGNLAVHPIGDGGVLREACHLVQHSGSGPHPRQDGPHAHQIVPDAAGRHVLATDLGTDSLHVYDFDGETGHLTLKHEVSLRAGTGPRHLAFHPSGERVYLLNELASTITELGYDPETGVLEAGRTISMLPADYAETNLAAEVVVTPDGRFVLASNRGHDSIAVFATGDPEFATGESEVGFRRIGLWEAGVAEPRHISLAPDGTVLFVAGQRSGTVRAFSVGDSGELTSVGEPVTTGSPACVLPVPG